MLIDRFTERMTKLLEKVKGYRQRTGRWSLSNCIASPSDVIQCFRIDLCLPPILKLIS